MSNMRRAWSGKDLALLFVIIASGFWIEVQSRRIYKLEERLDRHTPSYSDLKEFHEGRAIIRKNIFIGSAEGEHSPGDIIEIQDIE